MEAFKYHVQPGRYRHFKGNEYEVLGMARHSETEEEMVVYRPCTAEGGLWGAPGGYVGRRGGAGRQASAGALLHWRNVRACARRPNAIQWVLQNKHACKTV